MSEQEKFLDRWSRRKRAAADDRPPAEAKEAAKTPSPPAADAKDVAADVPFDPASLPPIESITAESDIRAFLKPGVPAELTRAALRRAWSADPQIRDFIGLVENGWNFNDPTGVPGFGPMPAGEDVARLLMQAIGASPPAQTETPGQLESARQNNEQTSSPTDNSAMAGRSPRLAQTEKPGAVASEKDFVQRSEGDAASQNDSSDGEDRPPSRPRGHGGALPK